MLSWLLCILFKFLFHCPFSEASLLAATSYLGIEAENYGSRI